MLVFGSINEQEQSTHLVLKHYTWVLNFLVENVSLNMLIHSLWWIMKNCYILIQVKDNSSLYINVLFYHCTLHVCSPWSPYSTRQFHNHVISIFSFIWIKGGGVVGILQRKHTLYFLTLTCLDNYTRIQSFKKKKEIFFLFSWREFHLQTSL